MRVLWVEENRIVGPAMRLALREAGHECDWICDRQVALVALDARRYDVVMLDLGASLHLGIRTMQETRENGHDLPFLIVSGRQVLSPAAVGSPMNEGLRSGRPIAVAEIMSQMRFLLERQGGAVASNLCVGELSLDRRSRDAVFRGRKAILTAREYHLLQTLMSGPGAVFSRAELEGRIYTADEDIQSNAVEFLIHRIRKKLGLSCIRNVRGAGWMIDASNDDDAKGGDTSHL